MCQLVSTPSTSVFSPNISRWVALRLHLIMLGCLIFENYTDHDQFHVWIRQQSRNMAFVDLINIQIQMQVARVENIRCNVSPCLRMKFSIILIVTILELTTERFIQCNGENMHIFCIYCLL